MWCGWMTIIGKICTYVTNTVTQHHIQADTSNSTNRRNNHLFFFSSFALFVFCSAVCFFLSISWLNCNIKNILWNFMEITWLLLLFLLLIVVYNLSFIRKYFNSRNLTKREEIATKWITQFTRKKSYAMAPCITSRYGRNLFASLRWCKCCL